MIPHPAELVLGNTHNFEIVKSDNYFGFGPPNGENFVNASLNNETHLNWIFTHAPIAKRSLQGEPRKKIKKNIKSGIDKRSKKKHSHLGKVKKCILKVFKKSRKKNRRKKYGIHSKHMLPLIIGVLAVKTLIIPITLKALAFITAKGLMMGFFSTALAWMLSLKGIFDHSRSYQNRKDDIRTQVEIIKVPSKNADHMYYDEHFSRGDYIPMIYQNV